MLIILIFKIWWLFSGYFASNMTFVLIPNFSTHQSPQALNPTVEDIRTHWFCFAIQTDSGWAPLLIESLLVMGGSVSRAQQVRKKKKNKKSKRNLRDASCLSQGENCVGSHNSHNTSTVLASLYVPLRGRYEAAAIDSDDSLPSPVILWEWDFFFRGLLGSCPTVWIQEFGSALVLVSWGFLK